MELPKTGPVTIEYLNDYSRNYFITVNLKDIVPTTDKEQRVRIVNITSYKNYEQRLYLVSYTTTSTTMDVDPTTIGVKEPDSLIKPTLVKMNGTDNVTALKYERKPYALGGKRRRKRKTCKRKKKTNKKSLFKRAFH